MQVKTNFFRVKFNPDREWFMYDIQILPAIYRKIKGPDEELTKDNDGNFIKGLVVKIKKDNTCKVIDLERGSTPLSRRILTKLHEDLWSKSKIFVVSLHATLCEDESAS
jgi:hypothetical protein